MQIDLGAAEVALLTLLSQPAMARGMGAAAARRARDLFAPEVVMAAHEELFLQLEQRRREAPADAHCARPASPQLDPVRVFSGFASHPPATFGSRNAPIQKLPEAVRQQRSSLWRILEQSLPASELSRMENDLIRKHHQDCCMDQISVS